MDFSLEKYADIVSEIDALCMDAVGEVVIDCPYNLEIDHDQFIQMESIMQLVTAREDGKLVGFHISIIINDIFYKGKKTAFVLFYLLAKEFRGGGKGFKMFEFADNLYKDKKVNRSFMSRKIHINNEKLFNKLGYAKIESNYEKYYD